MGIKSSFKKVTSSVTNTVKKAASTVVKTTSQVVSSVLNKTLATFEDTVDGLGGNVVVRTIFKPLSYATLKSYEAFTRIRDGTLLNLGAHQHVRMFVDRSKVGIKAIEKVRVISYKWRPQVYISESKRQALALSNALLSNLDPLCSYRCTPSIDPISNWFYKMMQFNQANVDRLTYFRVVNNRTQYTGTKENGDSYTYYTYRQIYTLKDEYISYGWSAAIGNFFSDRFESVEAPSQNVVTISCDSSYVLSLIHI